jgi:glycosyltransferase involved in cell wall biosynthesis
LFVSVVICSDQRSTSLRRTLQSLLCPSNLRVKNWEVLVVMDESARDGTADICGEFEQEFSGTFRFLVQKGKGKSNALNLGIASARGDVLAMADDDVLCAPDYIQGIQTVFAQPGVDGAQGRVLLDCDGGLPEWMSAGLIRFMSLRDYGDEVQEWNESLSGTNMVVRAAAARQVGGYAPELGPGGTGFAEDTEFSLRLLDAGSRFVYAPQILVRHQLPRRRLTKSFFRRRYFGLGRSHAYYAPLDAPLWRFGLYVGKNWLTTQAKSLWQRSANRPAEALDCECGALRQAGFFWQHWQFERGVPRQLSRITSWPQERDSRLNCPSFAETNLQSQIS